MFQRAKTFEKEICRLPNNYLLAPNPSNKQSQSNEFPKGTYLIAVRIRNRLIFTQRRAASPAGRRATQGRRALRERSLLGASGRGHSW